MTSKTKFRKVASALLAALFSITLVLPVLVACSTNTEGSDLHTYNEYISQSPTTWNTHNGTTDADTYVQGYTEIGLYDFTLSDDRSTYAFIDEMATGDPVNVTSQYVNRFGITETDASNTAYGKAWEITLNPDATWENGEAITAEDYVWSMERVLSPDMKNSAAATYITGDYEIYNANNYYNAGSEGNYAIISAALSDAEVEERIAERSLYFSLTDGVPILGALSLQAYHDMFPDNAYYFREGGKTEMNADARDWYVYLSETYGANANEYGYIQVNSENYNDIKEGMSILSENLGTDNLANWYNTLSILTYKEYESVPFEEVGIFATSNNSKFVIVFANALSQWDVKYLLTDNWIVYKPYYEEGYSQQGSLTVTNYGTSSGKYMGYGPYKMTTYQANSVIEFERNENWYGYNEEATNYHPGQYETDRIVCRIISDQNTALLEFESGNLDTVRLNANNMDEYRFSDYLLTRSASNTWSITFNSDAETLASIESDNLGNRRILASEDFRRAISLSIDRTSIGQNILAGSAAAYSFINSNYYYDMENDPDSIYRNSEQAMQSIVKLYGISYGPGMTYETLQEAYSAVSGYDVTAAREAFNAAYDYAIANGLYTDGENIHINIYNNSVSTQLTALANYIDQCVDTATEGTPFEGKVTIELRSMQTGRYDAIAQGRIEAIYYSFSGEYNDPNGMLANFVDPEVQTILECGFDPETESFSITYDFNGDGSAETLTKTYTEWQRSITASGEYYGASTDVKLTIMAELEYRLLSGFRTLPLVVGTDLTLRSMKVEYATNTSNIFAMYGGVRLMTYNYTDGEWANFIKDPSNLTYN